MTRKLAKKTTTAASIAPADYSSLLSGVSELLEAARRASARTVNAFMTATYWEVGRRIVPEEMRAAVHGVNGLPHAALAGVARSERQVRILETDPPVSEQARRERGLHEASRARFTRAFATWRRYSPVLLTSSMGWMSSITAASSAASSTAVSARPSRYARTLGRAWVVAATEAIPKRA